MDDCVPYWQQIEAIERADRMEANLRAIRR
jgi:hypothetical protein